MMLVFRLLRRKVCGAISLVHLGRPGYTKGATALVRNQLRVSEEGLV